MRTDDSSNSKGTIVAPATEAVTAHQQASGDSSATTTVTDHQAGSTEKLAPTSASTQERDGEQGVTAVRHPLFGR